MTLFSFANWYYLTCGSSNWTVASSLAVNREVLVGFNLWFNISYHESSHWCKSASLKLLVEFLHLFRISCMMQPRPSEIRLLYTTISKTCKLIFVVPNLFWILDTCSNTFLDFIESRYPIIRNTFIIVKSYWIIFLTTLTWLILCLQELFLLPICIWFNY